MIFFKSKVSLWQAIWWDLRIWWSSTLIYSDLATNMNVKIDKAVGSLRARNQTRNSRWLYGSAICFREMNFTSNWNQSMFSTMSWLRMKKVSTALRRYKVTIERLLHGLFCSFNQRRLTSSWGYEVCHVQRKAMRRGAIYWCMLLKTEQLHAPVEQMFSFMWWFDFACNINL